MCDNTGSEWGYAGLKWPGEVRLLYGVNIFNYVLKYRTIISTHSPTADRYFKDVLK